MIPKLKRAWINAPAPDSPNHWLHRKNVLVFEEDAHVAVVWFLDGPVLNTRILRKYLVDGWPMAALNSQ